MSFLYKYSRFISFRFLSIFLFVFYSSGNIFSQNQNITESDIQLNFSHERDIYTQGFNLKISSNDADAKIYYTLYCNNPASRRGILYNHDLKINATTTLKAVAITPSDTSRIYTHSYIFIESASTQPKRPYGFPNVWGGAKEIPGDYEMDPDIINAISYKTGLEDAFKSLPSLSLTMPVDDWFNHETGLYRGYPDTDEITEKPVTAEFIFNDDSETNFGIECGVQNQGGTSIVKWKSPKQSMRLLFKEIYGPTRLRYKLFKDSEINSINTLVVDNMLNATWIHPNDDNQREHAMYLRDQLTSDLHEEMGHLAVHGRYFHLYLNGLYWGICNLHERPDDAFLSEYFDAEREDFDIIKHGPGEVVSGNGLSYIHMLNKARIGFSNVEQLDGFQKQINLPAFIDYMILNFYLGNFDWARHNWYAGRNRTDDSGFQFYCWDSEHVMRFLNLDYNNTLKNNDGAPTEVHSLLKENEEYRMMFADAVYKHMFNDGALTPEKFEKTFIQRKEEIDKAIVLESARWGDYREDVSWVTYTRNRHWSREVSSALRNYIPFRRDVVIEQLRSSKNKLFPKYMPPVIELEEISNNLKLVRLKSDAAVSGDIYYTLDGSDPRLVGGTIIGKKYTSRINLEYSTNIKARFYSSSDKSWSAMAEKTVLFDKVLGKDVAISEIMYHPKINFPEYIELTNAGNESVNLNGFKFTDGIEYTFKKDKNVDSGDNVVLSNDSVLYKTIYNRDVFGQYIKKLSNSGETLILKNGFNQLVDSVSYNDSIPWPEMADGYGYSLLLKDPNLDNSFASNWQISDFISFSRSNKDFNSELSVFIYPNPFSENFKISLNSTPDYSERYIVKVYNSVGRLVKEENWEHINLPKHIELKQENPGFYIIKVISQGSSQKNIVLKGIKLGI